MNKAFYRDIGFHVKAISAVTPAASTAGATNGDTIDRNAHGHPESLVLYVKAGAATGGPSAQTLDVKLQDSADGSTWADVSGAAITQIVADGGAQELDVNLSGYRRHVRAVRTVGLTGGTSPTWPNAVFFVLGARSVPI